MPPLSDEIKDLITGCLQFEPNERPSVSEALSHSWFNLETATDQEIQEEFELRNDQTKTKWEAELSDRMKMRENFIEQLRESNYRANEMPAKKLTEPTLTNNVVFTTALAPTYVEKALTDYLSDKEMKYTTNNDEYKVQFVWGKKSGEMPTAINDDELEELLKFVVIDGCWHLSALLSPDELDLVFVVVSRVFHLFIRQIIGQRFLDVGRCQSSRKDNVVGQGGFRQLFCRHLIRPIV